MGFEFAEYHKEALNGIVGDLEMLLNNIDPVTGDKLSDDRRKKLLIGSSLQLSAIWSNMTKFDFDPAKMSATDCNTKEAHFITTMKSAIDTVSIINC